MRPILTDEAFAPPESKLFSRFIAEQPRRCARILPAIVPGLIGTGSFTLLAFLLIAVFGAHQ